MHTATPTHHIARPYQHRPSLHKWWVRLDQSRFAAVALVLMLSLIAAQLSAIVVVVQGQVQRAQLRDTLAANAQAARALCLQTANQHTGLAAQECDTMQAAGDMDVDKD